MARLWPGRIVEEGNLHVHISALRKSLDEYGEGHSLVVTVPGRGYRLSELTACDRLIDRRPHASQQPLPDKPSIAVMPFANMSGDPAQEYFADGMVEEIITALSRIRWLFVIARNSSFTYKGQAIDVKRVGRELGVAMSSKARCAKAAPGSHHQAADRREKRRASLGRPFRRLAWRRSGPAGPGGAQGRRGIEPELEAAEIRRALDRPRNDRQPTILYLRALRARQSWETTGL